MLVKETIDMKGISLKQRSTIDALRRCYMKWRQMSARTDKDTGLAGYDQRFIINELRSVIENHAKSEVVDYSSDATFILQKVLDSEYLETNGLYISKFEDEMLFLSPDKAEAQAFIDNMPCSSRLASIKQCVQDYIDGKTDIINSPDRW